MVDLSSHVTHDNDMIYNSMQYVIMTRYERAFFRLIRWGEKVWLVVKLIELGKKAWLALQLIMGFFWEPS